MKRLNSKFYRVLDDATMSDRWWLKTARDAKGTLINPEHFSSGTLLELNGPLTISVRHPGRPMDFTFADFDMPVASKRAASVLRAVAGPDFQSFPATIDNHGGDFEILNFHKIVKCLDEERSDILLWTEADGLADKVGQYRQIGKMRVVSSRIFTENIFRIEGWEVALIASEAVKRQFELENLSGVRFTRV